MLFLEQEKYGLCCFGRRVQSHLVRRPSLVSKFDESEAGGVWRSSIFAAATFSVSYLMASAGKFGP